jgi:hypothetical protein
LARLLQACGAEEFIGRSLLQNLLEYNNLAAEVGKGMAHDHTPDRSPGGRPHFFSWGCARPAAALAADDYQESNRLSRPAVEGRSTASTLSDPASQDARARFLKGVILTEQGKTDDAIKVLWS